MIPKIKAYNIATKLSNEQTFESLSGPIEIIYDDGISRLVHSNVVKFSSVYWRVCAEFGIAINNKICFSASFKSMQETKFSTSAGSKLMEIIFKSYRAMFADIAPTWPESLYKLSRRLAVASNEVYNLSCIYAAAYVTTVNIGDFVSIATDPELIAKKKQLQEDFSNMSHNAVKNSVEELISFGEKLMKTKHKDNPISNAVESGLMKQNQLNQVVFARGVVSDVDRSEFRKPILDSYTTGITNLADSHAEIKTAASAVEASKSDLEKAETDNRLIQQISMYLEKVHSVDCGSKHTFSMIVRDEDELKALEGTYFIDKETKKPRRIDPASMKGLIGQTIDRRSVLAGCAHPDENGACVICAGDLLQWAPPGANVGHWIAAPFGAKQSQGILSTKHFSGSAAMLIPQMSTTFNNWFCFDEQVENILLKKRKASGVISIIFNIKDVHGLSAVFSETNTVNIASSAVASLTTVAISVADKDRAVSENIVVADANRKPSFTIDLISYIREKPERLSIKDGRQVIVCLDQWDYRAPLLSMPMKSADMAIFQQKVKRILHGAGGNAKGNKVVSPIEVLGTLYDTVKDRFNINYSVFECMLYAYCAKDPRMGDYRLPKAGDEFHILTGDRIIKNRSFGTIAAYQRMDELLLDPAALTRKNRVSSPFDYMFIPHVASQIVDSKIK